MLKHLRRISSQTLIYGLGDAATRIAALLLLPIYTRLLSPDDYGKLALCTLFATITALILDFGQRTAFFRFYFDTEDPEARRRLTGTVLIFLVGASLVLLLPLLLFFNQLAAPLLNDRSVFPLIKIALITVFFDVGSAIPFAIFRAKQYAARYAVLSLARFLVSVGFGITAVVVLRRGIVGLIYANLFTSVVFFLICLALTVRHITWVVERELLSRLLRFGLPLVPASVAYWALNLSDRFFLQKYADLGQVGIYALSYSIAGVLHMVMGWFNTAYAPYCYSLSKDPDAPRIYARVMVYSLAILTFLGLGLSLFSREVLMLLTPPPFHAAARIVPLIVLAYLFFEAYYLISFGLDLSMKTSYAPFIIGTGALINLVLNLILIKPFGMMGAGVATVLSYLLLPLIAYPFAHRFYPIPYDFWRILKLFVVSIGIYLLGAKIKTGRIPIDVAVGIGLLGLWGLLLLAVRFFPASELASAQAISKQAVRNFRRSPEQAPSKPSD